MKFIDPLKSAVKILAKVKFKANNPNGTSSKKFVKALVSVQFIIKINNHP